MTSGLQKLTETEVQVLDLICRSLDIKKKKLASIVGVSPSQLSSYLSGRLRVPAGVYDAIRLFIDSNFYEATEQPKLKRANYGRPRKTNNQDVQLRTITPPVVMSTQTMDFIATQVSKPDFAPQWASITPKQVRPYTSTGLSKILVIALLGIFIIAVALLIGLRMGLSFT